MFVFFLIVIRSLAKCGGLFPVLMLHAETGLPGQAEVRLIEVTDLDVDAVSYDHNRARLQG